MFAVVPLMIVLMLLTMMVMLVSFRRLAMVVAILPLGLIGVVLSLLVFNRPLGFVAILGILALIGMIAKNAVILIVSIEEERADGRSVRDAVLASATGRLRPMMLTALSTVLGLIPIAPTVFWGPMAFAIMGGLMVATLLTLVFLPTRVHGGVRQGEGAAGRAGRAGRPDEPAMSAARESPPIARPPARGRAAGAVLELHLGELRQLFNSMDPAPFRERDLDPEGQRLHRRLGHRGAGRPGRWPWSCTWAAGRRRDARDAAATRCDEYFRRRAVATRRELRKLFSVGPHQPGHRPGLPGGGHRRRRVRSAADQQGGYAWLVKESLVIGGWVALWRPLEIFLYDWWPMRARRGCTTGWAAWRCVSVGVERR